MEQHETLPGSPRRRKPPLDLDAALYLQSQASLVQEPNNSIRGSCCPARANLSSLYGIDAQDHSSTSSSSLLTLEQKPLGQNFLANRQLSAGRRRHHGLRAPAATIYNNNYNNISVDYIDCVSNNDLALSPAGDGGGGESMKGIPHCKKHLRFHRNRIEPSKNNGTGIIGIEHQQQVSASAPILAEPETIPPPKQSQATIMRGSCCLGNNFGRHFSSFDAAAATTGDDESACSTITQPPPNQQDLPSDAQNLIDTNKTGVLYPISVDEVKKRTYFIGSVSQDSLLGHDELHRYFPEGKVKIFVCTWNQNRKRAPVNLNDLLLPEKLIYMPDIYAIGIQEAFSSQTDYLREWEIELQTTLGPNHVLLQSCSLGVLHLALFVRRDLIWFCSTPEESVYNSRSMPTNMIKTKGAVSIAFRFFGTSFMFTNCHFPAHENRLQLRIDEYQRIISSIDLPKNLKLLKPRYLSNDSTARFDCVFFMGDLNFRLEQRSFDETISILEDIFKNNQHHQQEPPASSSYEALTQNDELLKVMETNQAFHGFDECQIRFPPTYKFLAKTNKYDRQTRRVPSYTDRILFRSKRQRHIQCLIYDWLPQLLSSDHKPVYCLFDVLVRPGHEQNMITSLNAGLFQRTIYLEALKRRAEGPESMRDNGAGGSLICSIS